MVHQRGSNKRPPQGTYLPEQCQSILEAEMKIRARACTVTSIGSSIEDPVEECLVPEFGKPDRLVLPPRADEALTAIMEEYRSLFRTTPGVTYEAYHYIPTTGPPVKIPPRRIPAHYRDEIEQQLHNMLKLGIIEESSSPWMAPAVFVPKKSGEIRMCIDYRELNKQSIKDAYPLPLPDEVQDRLAGSTVFSTLDLQSGYWQLPLHPDDYEKTAFCPGPGMGLYHFRRMPFGLSGAPSSFQRVMDTIFRGLPFVTKYIDDVLVHSANMVKHRDHLHQVFQRLHQAGLTLRGNKCCIGMKEVPYLGHIFSGKGMSPDPAKVKAVLDWPIPTDVTEVHKFLGLASYYRRYIAQFSDIAAPLHKLTQKGESFSWSNVCQAAFDNLKEKLVQAPVLVYPDLS